MHLTRDARRPDSRDFDTAECKGAGHPDTLADAIADEFSRGYSNVCIDQYGGVLNHWVDKVTLIGAAANVELGSFDILTPIECHLIGKIAPGTSSSPLDPMNIFRESCERIFRIATGDDRMYRAARFFVHNTSGRAADHPSDFYRPVDFTSSVELLSNDTSACHSNSSVGSCGSLARDIERYSRRLSSEAFALGSDFKVMCTRVFDQIHLIVAVPVHADRVSSWPEYRSVVQETRGQLSDLARALVDEIDLGFRVNVLVNTKDGPSSGYIAPFGTSLGKGDCGAVGRGNRNSGVIEPLAPSSMEAPAGKNPLHHAGKVYTWLAEEFASAIEDQYSCYAEVTVVSSNGEELFSDPLCLVAVEPSADLDERELLGLWETALASASGASAAFLAGGKDPNGLHEG